MLTLLAKPVLTGQDLEGGAPINPAPGSLVTPKSNHFQLNNSFLSWQFSHYQLVGKSRRMQFTALRQRQEVAGAQSSSKALRVQTMSTDR